MKYLNKKRELMLFVSLMLMTEFVLADGGLGSANKLFENVAMALKGVGAIILTIAVMVAGYKVMWGGSTVRECAPVIVGGILLGSAAYVASLILES